ncbi:uncharacterized protein PRCAT00004787001 [Priceomyces carsonii]|uniref:uncharacterized protein n=1 Tax=Priceomyces carsonii TaxID=28549 RepID=UPI002ED876C5|nr:unnamed protein product [Priceomyces carsonii]
MGCINLQMRGLLLKMQKNMHGKVGNDSVLEMYKSDSCAPLSPANPINTQETVGCGTRWWLFVSIPIKDSAARYYSLSMAIFSLISENSQTIR